MIEASVVLVTGAGRRIGAAIARELHGAGWNVALHVRRSRKEAETLAASLEAVRAGSALVLAGDLLDPADVERVANEARACWGRLDALVNNASSYRATPMGTLNAEGIDELVGSNLRAPLLLTQACARSGSLRAVVNILDVGARRPRRGYSAYGAAKAGLWAATEALALELAPQVRVNGVAPGHMLWAEDSSMSAAEKLAELARVPLQRLGGALEIARAVKFLLSDQAGYITGAVLPVDGGLGLV
ncbi:MAG TPA: SDR family oxidoreductase [Solimonas sp.]|nr:SDR family oxidoreductase [Solimonas sp.]